MKDIEQKWDKFGRETGSMIYKNKILPTIHGFGRNTSLMIQNDAKSLLFVLSRYKFVAKMLAGKNSVLEVDCSEGLGTRTLLQHIKNYSGIDRDQEKIEAAKEFNKLENSNFYLHDIMMQPPNHIYDAVFSLDSLEHINSDFESIYIENSIKNLDSKGVIIIGCPTLESQAYASEPSKAGHINCKTSSDLMSLVAGYFDNVFCFAMNDEVVHTGFSKMAHYHFVLGAGKK